MTIHFHLTVESRANYDLTLALTIRRGKNFLAFSGLTPA